MNWIRYSSVSPPTDMFCLWMSRISQIVARCPIRTINAVPLATDIAIEEPSTSVCLERLFTTSYDQLLMSECNEWTSLLSVFRLQFDMVAILSTPGNLINLDPGRGIAHRTAN
jgi:hypothetical protein